MTFKSKNLSVIIFFFALGFFVYYPSVTSEFLNWDDEAYVTKNPLFKNLNLVNFSKLFVEYVLGNYHPITMITFFIEYVLFGDNAIQIGRAHV